MTPRYRLDHVVRRYRPLRSPAAVEALRVPSLEVAPGEILAVVGPNGSGKSTLLETMAFLGRPDEGRILLDGCDVWQRGKTLAARRRCPMLLQRNVLFKTTVLGNVMYGLRARGMSRSKAKGKAEHVLRLVRLETLARRTHRELSGGERQRVALARVLALEPEILLLDEPTAHVDYSNAQLIDEIIRHLHATAGMTVIVASHDLRQAQSLAGRVVTLLDGQPFLGTLDNLLTGTFRIDNDALTFHGEKGLLLHVTADAIVQEDRDALAKSSGEPVRIALDPDRVVIVPKEAAGDAILYGRIEAIDQQQGRCRVTVRLETGQRVCAALSPSEYARLDLNIGRGVGLRLADQALRVIRIRS